MIRNYELLELKRVTKMAELRPKSHAIDIDSFGALHLTFTVASGKNEYPYEFILDRGDALALGVDLQRAIEEGEDFEGEQPEDDIGE